MRKKLFASLAVAGLVILSACGVRTDDGTDGGGGDPAGSNAEERAKFFGNTDTEPSGTPKDTLNFGAFQPPTALDPVKALGTGTSGGIELHAIYDTLLTYNPETLEYSPRLAEDFSFNDDGTELTINLRDGVTFTDGTPLNAEAVIFSLKRHVDTPSRFGAGVGQATSMEAPDEHTVVLKFDRPNFSFLGDLTNLPGTVVSPTAVKKMGEEEFGNNPVGAGPYKLERWAPGEELVLTTNPDYWGEAPKTKNLRFVYLENEETTIDSLRSGSIDVMFTRDPEIGARLQKDFNGFVEPTSMAQMVFMNNREKYATSDPRVRKAMVHALDPNVINDRAYEGTAIPSKSVVPEGAALFGEKTSLEYDVEKAKKLVEEAKADGFDGNLDILCDQTPAERKVCQVLQAQFDAVGFNSKVEYRRDKANKVWAEHDFEVSLSYTAMPDTDIPANLWNNYGSTANTNVTGYQNPNFDTAGIELLGANTVEDKQKALAKVQQAFDEDPPIAMMATMATTVGWNDNVTGIVPSGAYTVFLDQAVVSDN
ncbi:ABC transporter substrate-binding protein [Enemella sp. A6]|uniref:ABC transporter substrate-binding protein n=1 Tax=Enemella sp. A6 TaxID=3440152 RepID=UPI003EBC7981